jgi:hypothetical protein
MLYDNFNLISAPVSGSWWLSVSFRANRKEGSMVDETLKIGSRPETPEEPGWVLWAIICAFVVYWWDKLAWPISLAIALVVGFGWLRYLKAKASWQRKFLDWQIENAEGWIAHFKANLAKGPPWFDGIDDDFYFDQRHGLENWKTTLAELKARRGDPDL